MHKKSIPTVVLGGSGYVAAEILGLLLDHPSFRIESVVSTSNYGARIDELFPHLTGAGGNLAFGELESVKPLLNGKRQVAVFSAMPHGETAKAFTELFTKDSQAKVVDVSADFRYSYPAQYAAVYGKPHDAPELLKEFSCGLPDLSSETPDQYVAHPGCFTTCVTLGLAPLFSNNLIKSHVQVSAVTGSTGAGRQLGAGTHHPHRQSSMWAYQPLEHRHKPEIEMLLQPYTQEVQVAFVPHSGPFSRGIHATIFAELTDEQSVDDVIELFNQFYNASPFIKTGCRMPTLKEVVGTNRCHIGVAVSGKQVVITAVIDNLVKGAAGGAIQWMNRMFGLDEKEGLVNAVPGWI